MLRRRLVVPFPGTVGEESIIEALWLKVQESIELKLKCNELNNGVHKFIVLFWNVASLEGGITQEFSLILIKMKVASTTS